MKSHRMEFFFPPDQKESNGYSYSRIYREDGNKGPNISTWIERFSSRLSETPSDAEAVEALNLICNLICARMRVYRSRPPPIHSWEPGHNPPFSDEVQARVLTVSVELDDKALFLETFEICPEKAATLTFQAVGIAFLRYDLESLLPRLDSMD